VCVVCGLEYHEKVTEEADLARRGSRYVWHVDPLDGTTNFAHGYPCFCASVGVALDGVVVAGAVYEPLKGELFTAERGAGAHLNGRRPAGWRGEGGPKRLPLTGLPRAPREGPH